MALVFRTSSIANAGPTTIKNSALSYEEGDGNFAYLLTNMSGSNINITGDTLLTGQLQLDGNVFLPQITSASQNNILTYNTSSGRIYYTSSNNFAAASDLNSYVTTASFTAFTSSYNTGSFSGSFIGELIGTSSWAVSASWAPSTATPTGSLLTTASVSNNTITFTKGDASQFSITVATGSGGSGGSIDTGSFITTGSATAVQSITGSLIISSSLKVTGSIATYSDDATDTIATYYSFSEKAYPLPRGYQRGDYDASSFDGDNKYYQTAIPSIKGYFNTINTATGGGRTTYTYRGYLGIGTPGYELHTGNQYAQSIFMYTDVGNGNPATFLLPPVTDSIVISDNKTLDISTGYTSVINARTANNRTHVLTVTGSFLARDSVSLGTNITNSHIITGSTRLTGSLNVVGNQTNTGSVYINGTLQQGIDVLAIGLYSHAQGNGTQASGSYSHAEGYQTIAIGVASHAGGYSTIASASYQTVVGIHNATSSVDGAFIVGNGSVEGGESTRRNLLYAGGTSVIITGSLEVFGSTTISSVLTLPYQHPLPSSPATGSIALSGSGATFVGMFVWTGAWTQI